MPDGYRLTDEDRETTADRRKRLAAAGPVILYGIPSQGELAQARGTGRGILVLPEQMRGHLPEMHTDEEWAKMRDEANDLRTTTEKEADENAKQARIAAEDGIVDITRYSEDTMFKVQAAITALGYSGQPVLDIIGSIQNAGILFRERAPEYEPVSDQEEHTHRTREARDRCAAGDHEAAELYDTQADSLVHENEAHIREVYDLDDPELTTMAEEPIEQRLRRAFVNGWREGFERGSWGDQRWDR